MILNSEALPCHAESVGPGRTKHPRSFLFLNSLRLLETVPFPPPAWGTVAEEYQCVLAELSQEFSQINGQPFLDLLAHWGELIQPNPVASPICRDPADVKFIDCLLWSGAHCLVNLILPDYGLSRRG